VSPPVMKPRTTITLLVLAGALFAFIFFYERHTGATGDELKPGRILPGLSAAAVTGVSVRPLGQPEIVATRKGALWRITQPLAATAHAAAIDQLLQTLATLEWHKRLTTPELKNRANPDREFGFDPPQFTVTLRQGDEKFQIQFGSRTALGEEIFAQVAGLNEIYVTDASLLQLLPRTVSAWRDPALVNLKELAFDRLTITNGTKIIELQRDATTQLWRMNRPLEARADNPKIESLLRELQTLRASQFVTDDPKAELEPYGLAPAALAITLAQGPNKVLALQFGKSPANNPAQVFARRADQTGICLVPGETLAAWRAPHEDFRDRHLAGLNGETVDEIEVHAANSFTVRRTSNDNWLVTAPEKFPADTALVHDLLGGIGSLQVTQFVKAVVTEPDLPNYGLAPAASQFILKSGASNNVLVQLEFSAPQGGKNFARRSDDTAVHAVRAEDLRRLNFAGWQLRERRLWNFTEPQVARLALRQGGATRELLRHGENKWAFATNSQGIINPFAVEEAVHRLGELAAESWLDRGDAARANYGFTNNPVQITLTVKRGEQTETNTLDFSGATPGCPPYGAVMLDGQPWIFEVSPALGELIRNYLTLPANP
jgi:hypothetical protein